MLLTCAGYELLYRVQTGGEEFWRAYMSIQATIAVKSHSPLSKAYNLLGYAGRALYFALPWSLMLLIVR